MGSVNPVAVVIAAYNEEAAIGDVLARIPSVVCGLATSVIVVDDGSSDRTASVASSHGATVCSLGRNLGQGTALRRGYELARTGGALYIATLDADGQYDPRELPLVVQPLVDGRADFVSGSRRLGRAAEQRFSVRVPLRDRGVVVFGWVLSVLSRQRITDPANGLRAMRASVTAAVPLHQPQYQAAELMLGAALRGFRIQEVGTTMSARTAGVTKKGGDLLYGARFARAIAATWWHRHRIP